MPELPEVEVVRRGLENHLTGRRLEAVTVLHPRPVRAHPAGAEGFTSEITGRASTPSRAAEIPVAGAGR